MKDMPDDGWVVDPLEKTCYCVMNLKDGVCVHVLGALIHLKMRFPGYVPPQPTLVNRRIKKSKPIYKAPKVHGRRGGRYTAPGPALALQWLITE
jgi:hypothetical protein